MEFLPHIFISIAEEAPEIFAQQLGIDLFES